MASETIDAPGERAAEPDRGAARHVETVIIGGGQAGLATSYHLARRGREHVILDADVRVGDGWRRRWPSLRLYSAARMDGLPGMRFPRPATRSRRPPRWATSWRRTRRASGSRSSPASRSTRSSAATGATS